MPTQTQQKLNTAQSFIYSRSNIKRAYPQFDETDIAGIHIHNKKCIVVRNDGTTEQYDPALIQTAYVNFTSRLKDFFSYLGPNYRGPSVWRRKAFIMFKGWNHSHSLGYLDANAQLQYHWADKFIHLSDINKVIALLQSDQTDLGHVIAPDGLMDDELSFNITSSLEDFDETVDTEHERKSKEPWCSCGSFQRQLNNLSEFQNEITGYKPTCIHLTWFHRYREFLSMRTKVRDEYPNGMPDKCVAWWYAPPTDHVSDGKFVLLYTKYGMHAPVTHWRSYKPKEVFTQHDAWDLFSNMMDAGYVPFPGVALPQLQSVIKTNDKQLGNKT